MNVQQIPVIWLYLSLAVYVIGLCASTAFGSGAFVLGFAAGGAMVLLNAWASARKVKKAAFPHKGPVRVSVIGGFYVRLILMGIGLYWFIRVVEVDPVGLVAGLSVAPAGLFVMLALMFFANRRPREV